MWNQLNQHNTCYYDILGVEKTASKQEIKLRFRELCLKLHPDKTNGKTTEQFKIIQKAWEILKDDQKRRKYDLELGECFF
jgi:DnaJ-class molecular chaperone